MTMEDGIRVSLFDMIFCISNSVDLIDQALNDHHLRTAYITLAIAEHLGLSEEDRNTSVAAAALHDIGAISLKEKLGALDFDASNMNIHAETGRRLLNTHPDFSEIAEIVRYHHTPWDEGRGAEAGGNAVPIAGHIIHLADRVAILVRDRLRILDISSKIREKIREFSGRMFKPELVDAFEAAADSERFWLDAVNPAIGRILADQFGKGPVLDFDQLKGIVNLISCIIDYRSRYTATHSAGVVSVADNLGKRIGMSGNDLRLLKIAGYLHDIGKLAVPAEILEKPGKLTSEEYNVIKCHPYWGFYVMDRVKPLETVNQWAAYHHERPDGKGYPFHVKGDDLPTGARVIAVADVFTSIKEDRPYRKGLPKTAIIGILQNMADNGALDPDVTAHAIGSHDEIAAECASAQEKALRRYEDFGKE